MEVVFDARKEIESKLENLDEESKMSILIDELKNENNNVRLYCVKHLTNIAEVLGRERTEEELIPLLIDLIINFETEDEILLELSTQLVALLDYITSYVSLSGILRGLELLCGNDDETVRQKATDNLCVLILKLDEVIITNEIFPLMQRLIQNDMKSKVSCCYLFPIVYPKLTNTVIKQELIQAFYEISKDDCPAVRRAAAYNIRSFSNTNDTELLRDLAQLHLELLKDNIDIVRVFAIESTKAILERISSDQKEKVIKFFTTAMEQERSWRVRYTAGEIIGDICSLFSIDFNDQTFLPFIISFLRDYEPEVRSSILSKLPTLVTRISKARFMSDIWPVLQDSIATDPNHHVRSIFIGSLLSCVKSLSEEILVNNILPLVTKIIKEETVVEVKHAAVEKMDELIVYFGSRVMDSDIIPLFKEISKDIKWRIRLSLVEKLNNFIGTVENNIFINSLLPLLNQFYDDHAAQIREEVIISYEKICGIQSQSWINSFLWGRIKHHVDSDNYLFRICALQTVDMLKNKIEKEFFNREILPYVNKLKNDPVSNVRFVFCKTLKNLLSVTQVNFISNSNREMFKNALLELDKDKDMDVRFFANEALGYTNY